MRPLGTLATLVVPFTLLLAQEALAQDATTAGTLSAPHPTLENISLQWEISGDANQNGVVTVRFREQGQSAWRTGLPLRRVPAASNQGFSWVNQHAGSVFDLLPDTTYEIELSLVEAAAIPAQGDRADHQELLDGSQGRQEKVSAGNARGENDVGAPGA